jgi:hypothetical protein
MNTQNYTIYKVYETRKGAEAYITRFNIDAVIEVINNRFFVIAYGGN